jgi:V/A-type H+-transporting ATPase subunit E
MEVNGDGGRIRIVNTLEKRLERGWPELLPDLIDVAYREIEQNAFTQDR